MIGVSLLTQFLQSAIDLLWRGSAIPCDPLFHLAANALVNLFAGMPRQQLGKKLRLSAR